MRYFLAIFGTIVILASLAGVKASQISMLMSAGEAMQKAGPPPETVSAAKAAEQTWEETLSAVASVVSARGVSLSNDSPGVVTRLHFDSGQSVKQGQLLVELDTSVERAQLESTRARRELAELTFNRSQKLATSGVSPQSQVDVDQSSFKSLTADASALQAQIGRKVIRAPFSGKLGLREVNLGQYLAPGTTVAVLESAESVFVDFTLPQQELPKLKVGMLVRATEESGGKPLAEGSITAIEPSLNSATRSVKVRASLPNQDERLRPGMFVRAAVVLPQQSKVVAIPLTSVVYASYGDSVFCLESRPPAAGGGKPTLVARQQFVRLGAARGDYVAVLDGVKPGEEVVTAGAFKLRNGLPVVVKNGIGAAPSLTPKPENQ